MKRKSHVRFGERGGETRWPSDQKVRSAPTLRGGNFLYVAYRSLKEIEMQVIEKIADNFTARSARQLKFGISRVTTKQFYGIDVLPVAVEVAKVTMMLAKELAADEWNKRISTLMSMLNLDLDQGLPLEHLDAQIRLDDALFCDWPEFDAVIGNPPYQSKNKIQQELGVEYVNRVRTQYPDVPGRADFCVYWFRRAHDEMKAGQRAGLVGTNTIRQNYSREGGLDHIVEAGGTITDAVSTQVWSGDAAVHVSIVNWIKGEDTAPKRLAFQRGDSVNSPFEYYDLPQINSALSRAVDLKGAKDLHGNSSSHTCYQGQTHGHEAFLLGRDEAEALIAKDSRYRQVLFPFMTTNDMLGNLDSLPSRYVIDFRKHDIFAASQYRFAFERLQNSVLPDRQLKAEQEEERNKAALSANPRARVNHHHANFFRQWWRLSYARNELMDALGTLPRYCVCGRVTKRPIFEFIGTAIHPNDALQVFALPDDYSFGILQSSVHWEWFTARCSTLKRDFRYTSETVFDSFPWPQSPSLAQIDAIAHSAAELRRERRKVIAKYGFTLRELYRLVEQAPDNPVSHAQEKLDSAVFAAYGLTPDDDILSFLLSLNLVLAEKEAAGQKIIGPGLPPSVPNVQIFISEDCVRLPARYSTMGN